MRTFQFSFLTSTLCIRMREILYVSQLFTGEMFVMWEILCLAAEMEKQCRGGGTPSQCRRVNSPGQRAFDCTLCLNLHVYCILQCMLCMHAR